MAMNLLEEVGDYLFSINFFNWGEPLINSEVLFPWISAARAKGVRTRVSSNLSLALSEAQIQNLVSSGLHTLVVSLDGASRETYSKYRINGDFDRVLNNIRRVVAEKKQQGTTAPLVVWQFLVFAHNEHEMDAARDLACELGVDEIRFSAPQVNEAVGIHPAKDSKYHTNLSKLHGEAFLKTVFEVNRDRCVWHYMMAAINWDGSVSPCCVLYKTKDDFGSIGELGQHSFMKAYNSNSYHSVRAGSSKCRGSAPQLVCFRCPASELRSSRGLNEDIVYHVKLRILNVLVLLHSLLLSRAGRGRASTA
jgi:MoaA/NifB/PqqE/SkfB family radical SAM enzyme